MSLEELSARLQSAKQLLAEKRAPEAIAALSEMRRDYPNDPQILVLLGAAHADTKNYPEAVGCLKASLAIKPSARTYYNLAMVHRTAGDKVQAISALQSALGLDPSYERASLMLNEIEGPRQQFSSPPPAGPVAAAQFQAPAPPPQQPPSYASSPHSSAPPPRPVVAQSAMPTRHWGKVIAGGLMVGLPFLVIWASWTSVLSGFAGVVVGAIAALAIVGILTKWLADNAGAYETQHWIAMILITGLLPSLLMMKGFDIIASGWYHTPQPKH